MSGPAAIPHADKYFQPRAYSLVPLTLHSPSQELLPILFALLYRYRIRYSPETLLMRKIAVYRGPLSNDIRRHFAKDGTPFQTLADDRHLKCMFHRLQIGHPDVYLEPIRSR